MVAEVALSLILLVGAGLMVKGVRALLVVNQNLDPAARSDDGCQLARFKI